MKALDRKLLRDLTHLRSQVISIALVMACGVMVVVAMRGTLESIRDARDAYYDAYRFAHVFATLQRAPEALAHRAAAIPGVGEVQTRVTLQVPIRIRDVPDPSTGLFVSVPSTPRPMPNDILIRAGRYVAADRDDEVLVSERFAAENQLRPADTLTAVINGRWQRLRIVGIATSPEYVVEIGEGGFLVDNRRFGIIWMRREALAAAAGYVGAFNGITLTLAPGAHAPTVIAELDRLLEPYGGIGAVDRADQMSNRVIIDEMHQLEAIGEIFPLFFLGTAAFLLNVVLSRLIATQRDEIGALKAFGYTNRAIALHYLAFSLAAVTLGAVIGVVGGQWMGTAYTNLYAEYFRFPALVFHSRWSVAALGIAISGGAAIIGALGAVRQAVRLPPAEALRPPTPARYRPLLLERAGFGAPGSVALRMILRNLERRPFRTLASIVGIALAVALLVAGLFPYDAIDRLIEIEFRRAQRDDLAIAFTSTQPARAGAELAALPGVWRVELFRAAPIRVRSGQHMRTTSVTGLDADAVLQQLVDADGSRYPIPAGGVVLTRSLAAALGAAVGDSVTLEFLDRRTVARRVAVSGVLDALVGVSAYMDRSLLNRLLGEGNAANGARLAIDGRREREIVARLGQLPQVAGVTSRAATLDYFNRTISESIAISATVVVIAAVVIAVGVVYNGSRITLSERARELASLRVLGFTRGEVARMFFGEQGILTAAGIPLGFVIGFGFSAILAGAFASERHRFPVVITSMSYLRAAGVVALASLLVAVFVRRRIDRLDLIAALKTGD